MSETRSNLMGLVTLIVQDGKRLLFGNGIEYVTVPRSVLGDVSAKYSLAKMKDPELLVYLACLRTATRTNVFTMPTSDLIELTQLTVPTIERALIGLRFRGLMNGKVTSRVTREMAETEEMAETKIELLNPATGKPIPPPKVPIDPKKETGSNAVSSRSYIEGTGFKAADVMRLLHEYNLTRDEVSSSGEIPIRCEFHNDRGRPNMTVNVYKGGVGYCHKCHGSGPFEEILARHRRVPREQITAELQDLERVRLDQQVYAKPVKRTLADKAIRADNPDDPDGLVKRKRKANALYPFTREADTEDVVDTARTGELLHAALAYARRGWRIIPLHHPMETGCSCGDPGCGKKVGKHPRIRRWPVTASSNPTKIRRWWRKWPNANIGIATGESSNLVVIDQDDKIDEDGVFKNGSGNFVALVAVSGDLPTSLKARSGSGPHLYYQHPGPGICIKSTSDRLAIGVDVRADGGYIIAPPSMHMSGKLYKWENDEAPAQLPSWLLAKLLAQ